MNHLRQKSPNIKTILYLWDNSGFYNYYHIAGLFDRVATYDLNDSKKYNAELLPFYWIERKLPSHEQYLLSIVGSNHSNRLNICRKVYYDLNSRGFNHLLFRIVDKTLPEDEIVTHTPIPLNCALDIIQSSRCILDTDRESQSGTTPRLIWALAMGKKVITTNKNIVKYNFYSPEQVLIIDRGHPIIPTSFLSQSLPKDFTSPNLLDLRIDNWVKHLLK